MAVTTKAAEKSKRKTQRQLEQQRKMRQMRVLFWSTGAALIVLIALAVVLLPKGNTIAVDYDNLPRLGSADAPVRIVEFGDFQCPICQYFAQQVMPQIRKDYIDTGKASLYFANFTIIGPDSVTGALAAQSVFHQNKDEFWKFYDALYESQGEENKGWLTADFVVNLAKDKGIRVDYDQLKQDIVSRKYMDEVNKQYSIAYNKARFNATPSLLINGQAYTGGLGYDEIKAALDRAAKGE
jgi:protein-disulfide isomerase